MKTIIALGVLGFVTAANAQSTNGWAADIVADTNSLWSLIVPLVSLMVLFGLAVKLVRKYIK